METVKLSVLNKDVLKNKDFALTTIATAIDEYTERHLSAKDYESFLNSAEEIRSLLQMKLHELATHGAIVKVLELRGGSGGEAPGDDF